jgi:hypothetical protein
MRSTNDTRELRSFQSNDAASEREQLIFSRDAFLLIAL